MTSIQRSPRPERRRHELPPDSPPSTPDATGLSGTDAIETQSTAEANISLGTRMWDLTRNAALLVGLWFAYALVRTLTSDEFSTAIENAQQVIDFQNAIGLPSEVHMQRFLLDHPGLIKAANTFYMWVHFPLTGVFVIWVMLRHRHVFPVIRDALILLTAAAMVLHVAFPLAPPRFIPGFFDTGALFGPSPYSLSASQAANTIAAMPSLHVGWAFVIAISVVTLTRSRWRYLAFLHPLVTSAVVVATANHYWVDAIVAILLVIGAWEFSARLAHHQLLKPRHESELEPSDADGDLQLTSSP